MNKRFGLNVGSRLSTSKAINLNPVKSERSRIVDPSNTRYNYSASLRVDSSDPANRLSIPAIKHGLCGKMVLVSKSPYAVYRRKYSGPPGLVALF